MCRVTKWSLWGPSRVSSLGFLTYILLCVRWRCFLCSAASLMSSPLSTLLISLSSFRWAVSRVLSPLSTLSNPLSLSLSVSLPLRAGSATGYGVGTSTPVRWEQVLPRDPDWPHCVTLALTHVKFVFRHLVFEPPFKVAWETCTERWSELRSDTWRRGWRSEAHISST